MIENVKIFFMRNPSFAIGVLVIFFILIRLFAIHSPLHQDEYKWPEIVNPHYVSSIEIPHPPLSQFIYKVGGQIVGYNVNLRLVPLFFGVINLLLLYHFLKKRFDVRTALIGGLLFTFSYFSVLASLMVDTDGQIIPFFFLLTLISYYRFLEASSYQKYIWGGVLALSCILGFFIKVVFVLIIGVLIVDFFWTTWKTIRLRDLGIYILYATGFLAVLLILLFVSQKVFSFFNLQIAFTYWKHFAELDRNWFQTLIQVIKAILYTSPLLVLTPFFLEKEEIKKVRPFILYILFGLIFYTILFDFSIGALDRYLQFLILPLCVLSAVAMSSAISKQSASSNKIYIFFGVLFSILLVVLLFVPHFVPTLHPKSAWISRVLSLRWNFLYPFSGGSGPLGFYVSFLFMALAWGFSIVLTVVSYIQPHLKKAILLALVCIGLVYNFVFINEYIFGNIYGSAPQLVRSAAEFVKNNPEIKKVTVYNDNGGNEIQLTGKYERRLYIDPKFEVNIQEKIDYLNTHKEHYFVLDIPRFDTNSLYQRYFNTCTVVYNKVDKDISAKIYDCRGTPNIKN